MVNAHVRALANTLYVILQTTVSNPQHSLERECRDETRVSFSHYRCLPTCSVSWRSFRHGTTRHLCRGKLRDRKCPHDARPRGCVARSAVQRTGPCRHFANRWESRPGLCGVQARGANHSKCECRLPVRRCLLAGPDTGAVTRPVRPWASRPRLPAVTEGVS